MEVPLKITGLPYQLCAKMEKWYKSGKVTSSLKNEIAEDKMFSGINETDFIEPNDWL